MRRLGLVLFCWLGCGSTDIELAINVQQSIDISVGDSDVVTVDATTGTATRW